jgi:hypothetical protein
MEIRFRNLPIEMIGYEGALVKLYNKVASSILANVSSASAEKIAPIIHPMKVEHIGKRPITLLSGDVLWDEPVWLSLISKNGEPFGNSVVREKIAVCLTAGFRDMFRLDTEVEVEFVNEYGLFIYSNGVERSK